VSDYLTHTWSKLPAVDVVTGEVEDPEPPADDATVTQDAPPVTEWPVTRVPGSDAPEGRTGADEPVDAVVVDEGVFDSDRAPF
jgi:hypothetical protein